MLSVIKSKLYLQTILTLLSFSFFTVMEPTMQLRIHQHTHIYMCVYVVKRKLDHIAWYQIYLMCVYLLMNMRVYQHNIFFTDISHGVIQSRTAIIYTAKPDSLALSLGVKICIIDVPLLNRNSFEMIFKIIHIYRILTVTKDNRQN